MIGGKQYCKIELYKAKSFEYHKNLSKKYEKYYISTVYFNNKNNFYLFTIVMQTSIIRKNGQFIPRDEAVDHNVINSLHYGGAVFEGIRFYDTDL